jgi:hypothetical protein
MGEPHDEEDGAGDLDAPGRQGDENAQQVISTSPLQ